MSANINIDALLNQDENALFTLLDQCVLKHLKAAEKELNEFDKFNKVLYETVQFTIQKYREEEGTLSKLFYRTLGIGKPHNKRREQLSMLGSNLKAHINQLKRDRRRVVYHQNNLISSYANLKDLADSLSKQAIQLNNLSFQNKSNQYLKIIYENMDELEMFKKSLAMKDIYLESCISNYKKLLKKIPRNKEIHEEAYIEYRG